MLVFILIETADAAPHDDAHPEGFVPLDLEFLFEFLVLVLGHRQAAIDDGFVGGFECELGIAIHAALQAFVDECRVGLVVAHLAAKLDFVVCDVEESPGADAGLTLEKVAPELGNAAAERIDGAQASDYYTSS